ncbi:unnamed protein product [Echinostoma caproni]|uniref:G_PROTEIN_RECEP_F1_2 domain-containing protein n=1 Tax=Echinostoma caproni TaxID=27848 RepID=A0A183B2C9_9TREM|nr:unnamed protein product [Echinostoma caproni]
MSGCVCYPFKLNLFRTQGKVRRAILIIFLIALIVCAYKPILGLSADTDLITAEIDTAPEDRSFHPGKRDDISLRIGQNYSTGQDAFPIDIDITRTPKGISPGHAKTVFILDTCYAILVTLLPFLVILSLNLRIITQLCQHSSNLLNEYPGSDLKPDSSQQPKSQTRICWTRSSRIFGCISGARQSDMRSDSISSHSGQAGTSGSESGRYTIGHYPPAEQYSWTSGDPSTSKPRCTHSPCSATSCSTSVFNKLTHQQHAQPQQQQQHSNHNKQHSNQHLRSFDPSMNSQCRECTASGRLTKFFHRFSCLNNTRPSYSHHMHKQNQFRKSYAQYHRHHTHQFQQSQRQHSSTPIQHLKSIHVNNNANHHQHHLPQHNHPQKKHFHHQHQSSCRGVHASRRGDRLGRQFAVTLLTISACFLILNIPYLIAWTCRWYQVRLRLYTIDLDWTKYLSPLEPVPSTIDSHPPVTSGGGGGVGNGGIVIGAMEEQATMELLFRLFPVNQTASGNPSLNESDPTVHSFAAEHEEHMDWLRVALPITRTIFSLNYCINFFLYSLVGKYFRRELCRLFWVCKYTAFSRFCPVRARQMVRKRQRHQPAGAVRLNMWRPRASTEGVVVPARFCPCAVDRPLCGVQVLGVNPNLISYIHTA